VTGLEPGRARCRGDRFGHLRRTKPGGDPGRACLFPEGAANRGAADWLVALLDPKDRLGVAWGRTGVEVAGPMDPMRAVMAGGHATHRVTDRDTAEARIAGA